MEETIKIEAKDFVISGIEKASGQFGINIEVRTINTHWLYNSLLWIINRIKLLWTFKAVYLNRFIYRWLVNSWKIKWIDSLDLHGIA